MSRICFFVFVMYCGFIILQDEHNNQLRFPGSGGGGGGSSGGGGGRNIIVCI